LPSAIATPATLVITGGEAATIPARFTGTAAILRFTGGSAALGPGTGTSLSVTTPALDRLTRFDKITDGDGPSQRLQLIWQQTMEAIETALEALTTQVGDNATLIAQIQAAQQLAQTANDNAVATSNELALSSSFINPVGVLTASNDGSIAIAAHQRVYADASTVTVNSGNVTGFAPGAYVTVFYADAARVGGAVAYQGSTSAVAQTGTVHVVGQVSIPAVGEPSVPGSGPTAPGYTPPFDPIYDPRLIEYELAF
jgi:hypothetical protein